MKKKPAAYTYEKYEQDEIFELVENICRAEEPRKLHLFQRFIEYLERKTIDAIKDAELK